MLIDINVCDPFIQYLFFELYISLAILMISILINLLCLKH